MLLGHLTAQDLAEPLDEHYRRLAEQGGQATDEKIRSAIERTSHRRIRAQKIGALAFIPFVGFLVAHAINHRVPLFLASFAGFTSAYFAIARLPKMRRLALREAALEYKEYLFLFPLFLSISLLQRTGFFESLSHLLKEGIVRWGASHVAYAQYWCATFLSAILDNNVVADFASKALHGLNLEVLKLFSMAQIAGYAVGGCWTHIGCAQSVVAYAFIRKEINPHYTPFQWIKAMTRVIVEISVLMTLLIYLEGFLIR